MGAAGLLGAPFLFELEAEDLSRGSQDAAGYYPPALTGMRGSHDGSFEAAHALRDGTYLKTAPQAVDTREKYDLVIVGAGMSGLAAAYFYRARAGSAARILILDNHDDFGGHAKRNEFRPGGRLLLANGGTWAIESPTPYSKQAKGLMTALGIDPAALEEKCAREHAYKGLGSAVFFSKENFGTDRLVTGLPSGEFDRPSAENPTTWEGFLRKTPFSETAQRDIARLQTANVDYMPGLSQAEKKARLAKTSYKDFLLQFVKVSPEVIPFYQARTHGLYGVGIDAVCALDCWAYEYPGFEGMNLDRVPSKGLGYTATGEVTEREPYYFHFPDGNASIARMLVRSLIPASTPGHTAEDIVTAKLDYTQLDRPSSPVRIRLNSTAMQVKHAGNPRSAKQVEILYSRQNRLYRVEAGGVVLACWNMMIPYLCPELSAEQKEALKYGVKVPLVYTSVAIRNWTAFQKLGVQRVATPGMYHDGLNLDAAVDIGDYRSPMSPDDPILVRMERTPCKPGLPERAQHRIGRVDLLTTPFSTFERNIRDQLGRVLSGGGFDPAHDIDAITVNRWPHGYAYEYNALFDPDWPAGERPCDRARRPFGRITIANSDAGAAAYTDVAMDEGYRAVEELFGT